MKKLSQYRSRGLDLMESRFGNASIQKFIEKRLRIEDVVRVLEIGFGEGRCLLDLRQRFPDKRVELYGVSYPKKKTMKKRSDLAENAKIFGIPVPRHLPIPYFYDAGKGLRFDTSSIDVIISQVAIHYIGDKAKLLEECWRVLKKDGKSFLYIDREPNEKYPTFMQLNKETPRFIIYEDDKMIKLSDYLRRFRKKGYDIYFRNAKNNSENKIILMAKNKRDSLRLGLEYDGNSSINLSKMKDSDEYKKAIDVWWGTRSVFRVK